MNDSEEKEVQVEVPKRSFGTKIIWGSLIALAVALGFFGLVFPYIQPENLSAEQIAEEWVDGNIDALEKEMVTFVAGNDWEVQDLGESVVGALVRENLVWQYGVLGDVGEDMTQVRVVGSAGFSVKTDEELRNINAFLPFLVNIDVDEKAVKDWEVDLFGASFSASKAVGDSG